MQFKTVLASAIAAVALANAQSTPAPDIGKIYDCLDTIENDLSELLVQAANGDSPCAECVGMNKVQACLNRDNIYKCLSEIGPKCEELLKQP